VTTPHRRIAIAIGACAAGLIAVPTALGATAPFSVQVGAFDQARGADLDGFYPRNAVVREGDKLTFTFGGFHTATFPKRGTRAPEPVIPTGAPTPATNDPAGSPYWFVGQPLLGLNPAAFAPTASKVVTGRRLVNSGAPSGNPATFRFVVSFPKRGVYNVYCALHPKMRGKVTVLPKKRTPPSGAVQKAAAAAQIKADRASLRRVIDLAREATADSPTVVVGPGTARTAVFAFLPAKRTVPKGTEITFRMGGRQEIHTVTFGPTAYVDALQARTFEGPPTEPISSEGAYPSDPPGTVSSLSPTTHGNGFLNSGVLTDPGIPGPKAFKVRFDTPGAYDYRCLVHPFMRGTITVA
jgi:plastocyanin